jgi:hypothetical protein
MAALSRDDTALRWHGHWHGIAIAPAEHGQVLNSVGLIHSLTCGVAVAADIFGRIQNLQNRCEQRPAHADSIPVRLRRAEEDLRKA